jgi:hypothetical protein
MSFTPYIQYHNGKANVKSNVEFLTDNVATAGEWKEFIAKITFDGPVSSPLFVLYMSGAADVYIDNVELLYQ